MVKWDEASMEASSMEKACLLMGMTHEDHGSLLAYEMCLVVAPGLSSLQSPSASFSEEHPLPPSGGEDFPSSTTM